MHFDLSIDHSNKAEWSKSGIFCLILYVPLPRAATLWTEFPEVFKWLVPTLSCMLSLLGEFLEKYRFLAPTLRLCRKQMPGDLYFHQDSQVTLNSWGNIQNKVLWKLNHCLGIWTPKPIPWLNPKPFRITALHPHQSFPAPPPWASHVLPWLSGCVQGSSLSYFDVLLWTWPRSCNS